MTPVIQPRAEPYFMPGNDTGCLLVVARGQLLGIVTERDLLQAAVDLIPGMAE